MSEPEKQRLVGNIAASLSQVSRKDIIDRSIANFRNADAEYGNRVAEAVANRRTSSRATSDEKTPAIALRT
jgi:catalase